MNKRLDSMTRIVLLVVLAFAVCLAGSCAKKPEPPAPAKAPQKTAPATPAKTEAPKAEVKPMPVAAEAPKPAAPAPAPAAPAPQPAAAPAPAGAKMVPIKIELPKPMFVGTPQDIKVDNLEKPLGRPRPAVPGAGRHREPGQGQARQVQR